MMWRSCSCLEVHRPARGSETLPRNWLIASVLPRSEDWREGGRSWRRFLIHVAAAGETRASEVVPIEFGRGIASSTKPTNSMLRK